MTKGSCQDAMTYLVTGPSVATSGARVLGSRVIKMSSVGNVERDRSLCRAKSSPTSPSPRRILENAGRNPASGEGVVTKGEQTDSETDHAIPRS